MKIRTSLKVLAAFISMVSCQAMASISYVEDASNGVDKALQSAFEKAVATIAPGANIESMQNIMDKAVIAASLNRGKLTVTFDENLLSQTVAASGATIWQGLQDPVLIWEADVVGNTVVQDPEHNEFVSLFNQAAQKSGFSTMYPVMDLDDIQKVSIDSILTHSDANLKDASARYGVTYFISGAFNTVADNKIEAKFNVYDSEGKNLGATQVTDAVDVCAQKSVQAIAKIFADVQNGFVVGTAVNDPTTEAVATDTVTPGPYNGFVRIVISGIENPQDLKDVFSSLIRFGYESSSSVSAYTPNGIVIDVPTAASPAILDGTLAHVEGFTKVGAWTYTYNKSEGKKSSGRGGIGKKDANTIVSSVAINTEAEAETKGENQQVQVVSPNNQVLDLTPKVSLVQD